jgi:hypothetical protein
LLVVGVVAILMVKATEVAAEVVVDIALAL